MASYTNSIVEFKGREIEYWYRYGELVSVSIIEGKPMKGFPITDLDNPAIKPTRLQRRLMKRLGKEGRLVVR